MTQFGPFTLKFTKSGKHVFRFDAESPDAPVQNIYIDKDVFAKLRSSPPVEITVSISVASPNTEIDPE